MRLGWLATNTSPSFARVRSRTSSRAARIAGAIIALAARAGGDDSSATGDDAAPDDGGNPFDMGPVTSCDPPGKFGVPENTFDLPATGDGIYYMNVQTSFPDVDW